MNELDIDDALDRYRSHPLLGPATQTLYNLKQAVNHNSDGWPYWQQPSRAAAALMVLIEGRRPELARRAERPDVTPETLRKALTPIKAFRTRQGLDFDIIESAEQMPKPPQRSYRLSLVMEAEADDCEQLEFMDVVRRALQASEELAARYPGRLVGVVASMSDHSEPYRGAFRIASTPQREAV